MYESLPASDFDAGEDTVDQMIKNTYEIYSLEQEEKWGTLAISIEVSD